MKFYRLILMSARCKDEKRVTLELAEKPGMGESFDYLHEPYFVIAAIEVPKPKGI